MMRKATKGDILKRIGGLRFDRESEGDLTSSGSGPSSLASRSLDDAFAIVARLIARRLEGLPDHQISVFQLLEPLDTTSEDLLPVIRWMAERQYLEIVERRRNGDWLLRTSDRTKSLFES